jgi:hypothetical protein
MSEGGTAWPVLRATARGHELSQDGVHSCMPSRHDPTGSLPAQSASGGATRSPPEPRGGSGTRHPQSLPPREAGEWGRFSRTSADGMLVSATIRAPSAIQRDGRIRQGLPTGSRARAGPPRSAVRSLRISRPEIPFWRASRGRGAGPSRPVHHALSITLCPSRPVHRALSITLCPSRPVHRALSITPCPSRPVHHTRPVKTGRFA